MISDRHIYEGMWVRSKDGEKISCSFRFDGKLKFKWQEGGASNIIDATKTSLNWDRDPNVTGSCENGIITWSNGSTWEKLGKQCLFV